MSYCKFLVNTIFANICKYKGKCHDEVPESFFVSDDKFE